MKILYSTWFVNHLPATRFASFWSDLHGYQHRTTTVLLQINSRPTGVCFLAGLRRCPPLTV